MDEAKIGGWVLVAVHAAILAEQACLKKFSLMAKMIRFSRKSNLSRRRQVPACSSGFQAFFN